MKKILALVIVIALAGCVSTTDSTVTHNLQGPCEQSVDAKGLCEAYFTGVVYVSGSCREIGVSGCSATFPFTSLEECQAACET